MPGSVFAGKAPVVPEADAPTDNEAVIKALRELAGENGGYIPVNESPRGTEVAAEATETESTGTESGEAG